MTKRPDKTGRDQAGRFKKGRSGNPKGCPSGSRHRSTLAAQVLLEGEAEALTRKAIDLALEGDGPALRLCLERLLPRQRDRFVKVELDVDGGSRKAFDGLLSSLGNGKLTPSEAEAFARVLDMRSKALWQDELEARIVALEERAGGTN